MDCRELGFEAGAFREIYRPIYMKKTVALLFVMLALLLPAIVHAAAEPLSVAIAVPAHNGERRINYGDKTTHFHVIVTNTSNKPQRIWREWCSWGYFGLTFEFTDEHGKKSVATKKGQAWTINFPDWWTLEPHESLVLEVYFGDQDVWDGFPRPDNGSEAVTMQAVFEFRPDDASKEHRVWTGRGTSKADKYVFYHWKPETK